MDKRSCGKVPSTVSGEDVDAILVTLMEAEGFRKLDDTNGLRTLVAGALKVEKALTNGAAHMQYRMRLHLMASDNRRPLEVEM
jgi:hypothetical protein